MINNIKEIEESLMGAALTAGLEASPILLKELCHNIGDVRLMVSEFFKVQTQTKWAKVMFARSICQFVEMVNRQLAVYLEALKQGKCIEVFCISSGQYREDDFWTLCNWLCNEIKEEKLCQTLNENLDRLRMQLAEAESIMFDCNPEMFEKYFLTKKLDYSDTEVVKDFKKWLYRYHTPTIDQLKELRALVLAKALKDGVVEFASKPSQKEMKSIKIEIFTNLLPYDFVISEGLKVAFAKFMRFVVIEDPIVNINYRKYGKYILNHHYDIKDLRLRAIFELDIMFHLINQEMVKLEPKLEKHLNSTVNELPDSNQQEPAEELFHLIHPSLDDEEGWKIHNEVRRLVRRQSVPDIIKYLRKLESKNIILLPTVSSVAYDELVRLGMPTTDGFSKEYFRKQYFQRVI